MGMKAPASRWSESARVLRTDWKGITDSVELARVVTALLGPAARRQGRRLLWSCPFHEDRHPSFQVDPQRATWRCWPCNLGGDAPRVGDEAERRGIHRGSSPARPPADRQSKRPACLWPMPWPS